MGLEEDPSRKSPKSWMTIDYGAPRGVKKYSCLKLGSYLQMSQKIKIMLSPGRPCESGK